MFQPDLFQKENFDKAEQLFHIGLKMATDMQHQNGITYVLDLMANLALDVVSHQLWSFGSDFSIKNDKICCHDNKLGIPYIVFLRSLDALWKFCFLVFERVLSYLYEDLDLSYWTILPSVIVKIMQCNAKSALEIQLIQQTDWMSFIVKDWRTS